MSSKTLFITCCALMGLAIGCGPGGSSIPPEETHTYIVSTADIPQTTPTFEAVGFNLDDRVDDGSGEGCNGEPDYTSPISGEVGVDNQLAANVIPLLSSMLPDGIPATIEEQIAMGTFLLLMEVTSNGLRDDTSVTVHLYLGTAPAGGVMLGADGRVAPGQTFTQMTDLGTFEDARLVGGHLSVAVDSLPLVLNIMDTEINLTLREAHIGADLTATALTNGEIGAQVAVADIVTLAAMLGLAIDEATIRSVAHPDLDPNADATVCAAISAGLSFESVAAANL